MLRFCAACAAFNHRGCPGPGSTCSCFELGHAPSAELMNAMDTYREQLK